MFFRYGAKARLVKKLRKNSDDLYNRLYEVFQDDISSTALINNAISNIEVLIEYIENSTDEDLEKKVLQALQNY